MDLETARERHSVKRQQNTRSERGSAAFFLCMSAVEIHAGLLLNGIPAGPDQSEAVSPVEAASAAVSAVSAAVAAVSAA